MKKTLIATGVALLAFASFAAAATFSNNLTVGSTGADVVALQNALIAGGFSIPSISSGAATPGYFGSQTKTAVMAYQSARNIPNTGFVGPLTRAALNAGPASVGSACPTGFSCTANSVVTPVCPVGFTCTSNTPGATPIVGSTAGISTPGVAGSIDLSNGSYVGNGTSVNDGQGVDIASVGLQAGSSDMQVSSVAIDFNVRPWLYMSSLSLVDTSGHVVGEVDNLNSSNFSEITVGSDYRITIPMNLIVSKATKPIVVLHGQFATNNRDNVFIYVTQLQVRAVDGTGVTLTSTLGDQAISGSGSLGLYVSYSGENKSNLLVSIDGSSPQNGVNVQTNSGNTQTKNVLLAVYKMESQNTDSTLQGLTVNVSTNQSVGSIFGNVQLYSGSVLLSSGSIGNSSASSSDVTFTNFNLKLPADTYVPITVEATVQGGVNNAAASTSLTVTTANITGIDASTNPLTMNNSDSIVNSGILNFTLNGVNASNIAVGTANVSTGKNGTTGFTQDLSFTLNAGNSDLYVSKNPAYVLGVLVNGYAIGTVVATSSALSSMSASTGSYIDNGSSYSVPAGTSRTFTITASISDLGNAAPAGAVQLTSNAIYYSTSSTIANTSGLPSITTSLDNLKTSTIQLTSTN
jgi:hypothetical protein